MTATGGKPAAKRVVMLVPGGLEHAGGIGRWAGYLQAAWQDHGLLPPLEIVDTRGVGGPAAAAVAFARALLRLAALRAAGQLGGIHANLSKRGSTARKLIVAALAGLTGTRLVLHLHGSGYDQFYRGLPKILRFLVAAAFRRADRVIVLGQFWADWVTQTLGVPAARVTILYNGVPRPTKRPDAPRLLRPSCCRIVMLGRIGPRKGVPELLQALASDALRGRGWVATLAGDGDLAPYRRYAAEHGLATRVTLPGWVDAQGAADLLAAADILVLPSHAENFPISVIEALAARVAIVCTPVGATPELLEDGNSALFVPVGDAVALEHAIIRLIDDPELRRRIADAGHAVFERQLDISALARRLAALHADAMRLAPC